MTCVEKNLALLISVARSFLEEKFRLRDLASGNFGLANAFLSLRCPNRQNLWLSADGDEKYLAMAAKSIVQAQLLRVFQQNLATEKHDFSTDEKILCQKTASLWEIKETSPVLKIRQIHPTLHAVRTSKEHLGDFVWVREKTNSLDRKLAYYTSLFQSFAQKTPAALPFKNPKKLLLIGSQKELESLLPFAVPFKVLKKDGSTDHQRLPFDPLAIIAPDYDAARDWVREKAVAPPVVVFVGNRYEHSTTNLRRDFRAEKIEHCLFIGSAPVETAEFFPVLHWHWTLRELHLLGIAPFSEPEILPVAETDVENFAQQFFKILKTAEQQSEGIASLRRPVFFLRRAFGLAGIEAEGHLKNEVADLKKLFFEKAHEWLADELSAAGMDNRPVFDELKNVYFSLLDHIQKNNPKARHFRQNENPVERLVVRKRQLENWKKEQSKLKPPVQSGRTLADLGELSARSETAHFPFKSLKNTQICTRQDFEKAENQTGGKHFFLSIFGYETRANELLESLLQSPHRATVLLYPPEMEAFAHLRRKMESAMLREWKSDDRERLAGLKWQANAAESFDENLEGTPDGWLEMLLETSANASRHELKTRRYEIHFTEGSPQKEAENRRVLLENGGEAHYKIVRELKPKDCIRLYRNVNTDDIFRSFAELKAPKGLFEKAKNFSERWKNGLRQQVKLHGGNIAFLFQKLKKEGLSVEESTLRGWLAEDSKIWFPQQKKDLAIIIQHAAEHSLQNDAKQVFFIRRELNSHLIRMGAAFSDEINHYLISGEKSEMLGCLDENELLKTIQTNAAPRTVKSIQLLDNEYDTETN